MQTLIDMPAKVWGALIGVFALLWTVLSALSATGFISPVAHSSALQVYDVKVGELEKLAADNRVEHKEMRDDIKALLQGVGEIRGKLR